jgi:Cof subfamily protein (haloacid dehalogenase superfamily)
MKEIKLLALDMDGTILHDYTVINEPVVKAIKAALQQGVRVLFASGRNFINMRPFFERMGFDRLDTAHITNNGCTIVTPQKQILYHAEPPRSDYETLLQRITEHKLSCAVATDVENYSNDPLYDPECPPSAILNYDELRQIPRASRLSIKADSDDLAAALTKGLAFEFANAIDNFYDIWPQGVDKGTALEWVAGYYGIPLENTMAIGDGDNDLGMLRMAGLSAAMGQGSQRAKATATMIAPSIHENGVAFMIEKYILKA